MDSSDYRSIPSVAPPNNVEYLVVGPFPAGDRITDLTLTLSAGVAGSCQIAPALTHNGQPSADAHGSGIALIGHSEIQVNGINTVTLYQAANTPSALGFKLDRTIQGGQAYVLVAVLNGAAAAVEAFANARSSDSNGCCR